MKTQVVVHVSVGWYQVQMIQRFSDPSKKLHPYLTKQQCGLFISKHLGRFLEMAGLPIGYMSQTQHAEKN